MHAFVYVRGVKDTETDSQAPRSVSFGLMLLLQERSWEKGSELLNLNTHTHAICVTTAHTQVQPSFSLFFFTRHFSAAWQSSRCEDKVVSFF